MEERYIVVCAGDSERQLSIVDTYAHPAKVVASCEDPVMDYIEQLSSSANAKVRADHIATLLNTHHHDAELSRSVARDYFRNKHLDYDPALDTGSGDNKPHF